MASYFNLTLDTTAPGGVTLSINSGATYCTGAAVIKSFFTSFCIRFNFLLSQLCSISLLRTN